MNVTRLIITDSYTKEAGEGSLDISVCIKTKSLTADRGTVVRFPARTKLFSSLQRPDGSEAVAPYLINSATFFSGITAPGYEARY